jgi:hypothetical protein
MQLTAYLVKDVYRVHKTGCSDVKKALSRGNITKDDLVEFDQNNKSSIISYLWGSYLDSLPDDGTTTALAEWPNCVESTKFASCGPHKLPEGDGINTYFGVQLTPIVESEPDNDTGLKPETIAYINSVESDTSAELTKESRTERNGLAENPFTEKLVDTPRDTLADEAVEAYEADAQNRADIDAMAQELGVPVEAPKSAGNGFWVITAHAIDGRQLLLPEDVVLGTPARGRPKANGQRFTEASFRSEKQLNAFLARNPTSAWSRDGERVKIHVLHVTDPSQQVKKVAPTVKRGK